MSLSHAYPRNGPIPDCNVRVNSMQMIPDSPVRTRIQLVSRASFGQAMDLPPRRNIKVLLVGVYLVFLGPFYIKSAQVVSLFKVLHSPSLGSPSSSFFFLLSSFLFPLYAFLLPPSSLARRIGIRCLLRCSLFLID